MLLDMLAAVARKDYEDRRRREAQGRAKAKAAGLYKGRPEDTERNACIAARIQAGASWTSIQNATGCSRATIAKIAKRAKQAAQRQRVAWCGRLNPAPHEGVTLFECELTHCGGGATWRLRAAWDPARCEEKPSSMFANRDR